MSAATDPELAPDEVFLTTTLASVDGWLFEPAGLLSQSLVETQVASGPGAVVEVGVFQGRYLAALCHALKTSAAQSWRVLGIDTFQWVPEATVQASLERVLGPEHGVALWRMDSLSITPAALQAQVAGRPIRFISIDGDHAAASVQADLQLARAVLHEDGVVALDDFLNPLAFGVTEGATAFLREHAGSLAPFCYASNKLFLCRPGAAHAAWSQRVRDFVAARWSSPLLRPTRALWELGEPYYRQTLYGQDCLVLSRRFDG